MIRLKYYNVYKSYNNMNTDVTKMDLKDLKSLAYDILVSIEQGQKNLQVINQEITKRLNEKPVEGKLK